MKFQVRGTAGSTVLSAPAREDGWRSTVLEVVLRRQLYAAMPGARCRDASCGGVVRRLVDVGEAHVE